MKPFIVAEISANHSGNLSNAIALVENAARAGADAIKLQTWTPGTMVVDKGYVLPDGPWAGQNLATLYEQAHTPWGWHQAIFDRARDLDIMAFSSPFDAGAVRFLQALGCPMYKIASFEVTDLELIRVIAQTGKPIVMSTGMASEIEIAMALDVIKEEHAGLHYRSDVTLLKCVSAYPAEARDMHLRGMHTLKERFRLPVGLSDHTKGLTVALVAAALGASMIEKHLVLNKGDHTLDAAFSINPIELATLVRECERAQEAMGIHAFDAVSLAAEEPQRRLRRSLHYAHDLVEGTKIEEHHLVTARPATGLPPYRLRAIVGCRVNRFIPAGTPVTADTFGPIT